MPRIAAVRAISSPRWESTRSSRGGRTERDEPGTWSYSGAVDLQTETAAVIRGVTTYTEGPKSGTYENVWLVRFDEDGRAEEFQDWWFQREG